MVIYTIYNKTNGILNFLDVCVKEIQHNMEVDQPYKIITHSDEAYYALDVVKMEIGSELTEIDVQTGIMIDDSDPLYKDVTPNK